MTSFVEYYGHGFACRNAVLADWLRVLVAEARPRDWPWLPKACLYWDALASALKSTRVTFAIQSDIDTKAKQVQCEELFAAVGERPGPPAVRRCALLTLALIRGELTGTPERSAHLWSGDEWKVV